MLPTNQRREPEKQEFGIDFEVYNRLQIFLLLIVDKY